MSVLAGEAHHNMYKALVSLEQAEEKKLKEAMQQQKQQQQQQPNTPVNHQGTVVGGKIIFELRPRPHERKKHAFFFVFLHFCSKCYKAFILKTAN